MEFEVCSLECLFVRDLCYLVVSGGNGNVLFMTKDGVSLQSFIYGNSYITGLSVSDNLVNGYRTLVIGSYDGEVEVASIVFSELSCYLLDREINVKGLTNLEVNSLAKPKKIIIRTGETIFAVSARKEKLAVLQRDKFSVYHVHGFDKNPYSLTYSYRNKVMLNFVEHERSKQTETTIFCCLTKHVIVGNNNQVEVYDIAEIYANIMPKKLIFNEKIANFIGQNGYPGAEDLVFFLFTGEIRVYNLGTGFFRSILETSPFTNNVTSSLTFNFCRNLVAILLGTTLSIWNIELRKEVYKETSVQQIIFNLKSEETGIYVKNDGKTFLFYFQNFKVEPIVSFIPQNRIDQSLIFFDRKILVQKRDTASCERQFLSFAKIITILLEMKDLKKAVELVKFSRSKIEWQLIVNFLFQKEWFKDDDYRLLQRAYRITKEYDNIYFIECLFVKRKIRAPSFENAEDEKLRLLEKAEMFLMIESRSEALKAFKKSQLIDYGVEDFLMIKDYSAAKELLEFGKTTNIISTKTFQDVYLLEAEEKYEEGEFEEACDLFFRCYEIDRAIVIALDKNLTKSLINFGRRCVASKKDIIRKLAVALQKLKKIKIVKEFYLKINDTEALIELYLKRNEFNEAFSLSRQNGNEFDREINVKYAMFLAQRGEFERAYEAFDKADNKVECIKLLKQLFANSLHKHDLYQASYFAQVLNMKFGCFHHQFVCALFTAAQVNRVISTPFKLPGEHYNKLNQLAVITRVTDPDLADCIPLIEVFEFVVGDLSTSIPFKIKEWAFKEARKLSMPIEKIDSFDLSFARNCALYEGIEDSGESKGDEDDLILCYRCSMDQKTYNTMVATSSLATCPICFHPFMYSFCSKEILPLVEFGIPEDITIDTAIELIDEIKYPINDTNSEEDDTNFENFLYSVDFKSHQFDKYKPVIVSQAVLENLPLEEVYIKKISSKNGIIAKFYKNIIPEVDIHQCETCQTLFLSEEFEEESFRFGNCCPCCRVRVD